MSPGFGKRAGRSSSTDAWVDEKSEGRLGKTPGRNHRQTCSASAFCAHSRRAVTLPFETMWTNRSLIHSMTRRDILGRYRGSFGGATWAVLNPLFLMPTYFFIFGVVLEQKFNPNDQPTDYVLYFLAGMLPWLAFSEAVGRSPSILIEYRNFIKKLRFPVETLPVNIVGIGLGHRMLRPGDFRRRAHPGERRTPAVDRVAPAADRSAASVYRGHLLVSFRARPFLARSRPDHRLRRHAVVLPDAYLLFRSGSEKHRPVLPDKNPIYTLVRAYRSVLLEGHAPDRHALVVFWCLAIAVFLCRTRLVLQIAKMVCGRDLMRLGVFLLPALLCGIELNAADCAHPGNSSDKAICTHPDLRAMDRQIERMTTVLKAKLTGENAAILADTEMPFLRQRNDCSNQTDIPACVQKVLAQRLDLLNRAQSNPDAIHEAFSQAYYIDVGFVWKYWPRLLGRNLSVFGCLSLNDASAGDTAPRIHAELEMENQPSIPVIFKSMPKQTAEFLDDQRPCSHWLVTVRKQGDKFVLYADEVLGSPLP